MTLQAYLKDPCGTLSIPYWKNKTVTVPPFMRIVHQRDYDAAALSAYADEPYFRLLHDLREVAPAAFACRTAEGANLPLLAEIINRSYTDLSVTVEQLRGYRATAAFAANLWVISLNELGAPVGCGIADIDPEVREGVLEWIQVLPEYRGRGVGQSIVNELLRRMQGRADFATVSGKVNNLTRPERLYRRCGFTGDDVWHVLTQR